MAGIGTWGDLANPASYRKFSIHLMDSSGDTYVEQLFVALNATYVAVQQWVVFYQLATQSTAYSVTEEKAWSGDADPDNADTLMRSGIENGINLSFRNATTRELRPLRVVAPDPATMQGNQDIPLLSSIELTDLITATLALQAAFSLRQGQYTTHRERKNNPKVK